MVIAPLAKMLGEFFHVDPADFDTVAEIEAKLQEFFGSIPILGDLIEVLTGREDGDLDDLGTWVNTVLRPGISGLIDMARIPQLSLSQLTSQPGPNLLTGFGDFADAESMDGGGVWVWDASVGGGSARTTGDGARKVLTSELVAVSEGQALALAGKVQWSGAAGTGPCMRLVVMPFVGDTALPEVVISSITSPPASSTGFVSLSGNHTVAANVTGVRVRLAVEAALTAGTVWWDDVTLRKTATSLPQQWISGLTTALGDLGDDIEGALAWIKDLIEKLTGQARATIEDAIADVVTFGTQIKTILSGGHVSSPLPNLVGAVVGTQQTVLNQIGELFDGGSVTPINSVVQAVKDGLAGLNAGISGATNSAVQAVVDGMNGIGSFAAAIVAAINAAIQDILNSIFGDGGTRWGQEVYVAAGPVAVGFNDVPLGFGMPFGGKINEFMFYSSDHLSNGSGTKVVVEIRRNGTAIHTYTWAGGSNSGSVSGLNLTVVKGDRITFYVTEATSLMANMSISVLGKYT
nr:hypothetical protein [Gordonia sp. NB41Y]EMP10054.2 hypothetical protein ISGA_387 [Gordonia sp. NB41Y]